MGMIAGIILLDYGDSKVLDLQDNIKHKYHLIKSDSRHNNLDWQDIFKHITLLNYLHKILADNQLCRGYYFYLRKKELILDMFKYIEKQQGLLQLNLNNQQQRHKIFSIYQQKVLQYTIQSIFQCMNQHNNLVKSCKLGRISMLYYHYIGIPWRYINLYKNQFSYQHNIQSGNFLRKSD